MARVSSLPDCDFCRLNSVKREARYDFRTLARAWAYGCVEHYLVQRASSVLGTGHGQLLVAQGQDEVWALFEHASTV